MASPSRKKKNITVEKKYELFEVYKRGIRQRKTSQINSEFHQTLKVQFKKKQSFANPKIEVLISIKE